MTVQTLEEIATKLNIAHWDVKRNSCSGGGGLSVVFNIPQALSNVTCDCTFINNSVCHVTNMYVLPSIATCLKFILAYFYPSKKDSECMPQRFCL